jgi:hypothetical protein
MRSVPLSNATTLRLQLIFPAATQSEAESLLVHECGANLPQFEDADPQRLERIRFAALKVSNGTVAGLQKAIQEAQIDWRDLLVWAQFADDADAHLRWLPES